MRLLIDTNRFSDMDAGDTVVVKRFESADELWLPLVVLGELFAGFELGDRKDLNERQLNDFIERLSVGVLAPDMNTARRYGEVFHALRRQGTPIPTNDIWIAALALQHDLMLDTRDRHFVHVQGLKLVPASS